MSTTATAQQTSTAQDEQNILQFIENMAKAFENRDVQAIMDCYVAQPLVVMQPELPVTNRQQLRDMFSELVANPEGPKFEFYGHEVFVNGDQAMHLAPWKMRATAPDGTAITDSGFSAVMLERQPNGSWLIVFDNPHAAHLTKKQ